MAAGSRTEDSRIATVEGLARYRLEQRALAVAAAAAAGGVEGIETTLAAMGWSDVLPDRLAIATAAQREWWQGLLARVDAGLDDDLAGMTPAARTAAVRAAWSEQRRDAASHLLLSSLGAGTVEHDAAERRFARLLALFAGTATVVDDFEAAADVGLALVRELGGSGPGPRLV